MKLVIFVASLSAGGAERVSANLANYWAEKGWTVTLITLASREQDFYESSPKVNRIALDLVGESANPIAAIRNNLLRVLALRRVLRQEKPEIALAMMDRSNVLLALASIGLERIGVIGSERSYPPQLPLGRLREVLRAKFYGRLSVVVALTQESAKWLGQHTSARAITVIPNAVTWPIPEQSPYLEPPVKPTGQRLLLAVGRLSEEKQHCLLIDVFQRLVPEFPNWQLVILGEGPDRNHLESQIESAGLNDRISLPGRAGNVGQWYEAADFYVMSSRFEGFPNTLVEAMAHGLPAVSFDCDTGPRDIIRHEVDGLLVQAGDTLALEGALRRLMRDDALRRQYAERAVEVRERFSMEKVTGRWEVLFEDLVKKTNRLA